MSLQKQNTTRKKWADKKITELNFKIVGNNQEYKVKTIWNSTIYAKEAEDHLSGLYYLVL